MTSEQKQETKDKVANKIAGGILRVQGFVSERMNRFQYLKGLLIGFCVLSAGLSTYFLISAIVSKPKQNIRIDRISSPQPMYEPSEDLYDETIPDDIYEGIQEYKRYMDSTGEAIRPGLADSIRVLEEMYLQQRKK